ncbi:MAG TPA: hypothetical protein VFB80_04625 [Pirellulaceae bacterium]|nr:hypothetical protein [Pirellulaceae bacterium]
MTDSRPAKARLGCGFLLVSAALTCVMLAINGLIVTNLVAAYSPGPLPLENQRVAQAAVFLGPVVLLFVEWWIFDVALDWLRPQRAAQGRPKA